MTRARPIIIAVSVVSLLIAGLAWEIITTQPVRGAVRSLAALFTIANRPDLNETERLAAARELCSAGYLATHPLAVADEGGIKGIPRNIDKNFRAWRQGANVWVCPTNRIGPVYQFVYERDDWRFDGPAGVLGPQGEFHPASELPE